MELVGGLSSSRFDYQNTFRGCSSWSLWSSTLRLTPAMLVKVSHDLRSTLWKRPCLSTNAPRTPSNNNTLVSTQLRGPILLLSIDNRTPLGYHGCFQGGKSQWGHLHSSDMRQDASVWRRMRTFSRWDSWTFWTSLEMRPNGLRRFFSIAQIFSPKYEQEGEGLALVTGGLGVWWSRDNC